MADEKPQTAPTLAGKGVITTDADFNYPDKGVDNSKYSSNPLEIKGANFDLPEDVIKGALLLAQEYREIYKKAGVDIAQSAEFRDAAKLDGDGTSLTDKELASVLLAKSMSTPVVCPFDGEGGTKTEFFNVLRKDEVTGIGDKDPKVVFEMAKQILGDAFREKVGGMKDTTSPEGNKPYIDAVEKSPQTETLRC